MSKEKLWKNSNMIWKNSQSKGSLESCLQALNLSMQLANTERNDIGRIQKILPFIGK